MGHEEVVVEDASDADVEAKRAQMMDRLRGIEASRRADLEARRAEASDAADPRENVRSFLARFEKDRDAVETRLDAARARSGDDTSKGVLDDLRALVATMEANTAEASYFLPSYDARACASATERLRFSLDAAAAALAPRAKFSFKKKKKATRGAGNAGDAAGVSLVTRRDVNENTNENEENKKEKAEETEPDAIALDALAARVAAMAAAADASGFKDAVGETFVFRGGDAENPADAPDLILERLSGCVVFVLGAVRALRCHDLRDTKVYGGPVAGSAHLQNLEGCHVEIAARQVRVHDARRVAFYVRTKSRPIIEHSSEVTFAPFAFEYEGARARFAAAGLAEETDAWRDVDDFGWIKNRQSPNWRVAPESDRVAPPPPPPPPP